MTGRRAASDSAKWKRPSPSGSDGTSKRTATSPAPSGQPTSARVERRRRRAAGRPRPAARRRAAAAEPRARPRASAGARTARPRRGMLALLAVRRRTSRALRDPRLAAPPLAQTARALGRIALVGEQARGTRSARRASARRTSCCPSRSRIARSHSRSTAEASCETNTIVPPFRLNSRILLEALALERLVADREHLVEQQHVRVEVRRDREAEPHEHPRRVRAHRDVDEVLELRERDDLVEALADVRALQAEDRAVEVDVLAAGEVGMEAGAELEQRADPCRRRRRGPAIGLMIPARMRSSVLLPEPLRPTSARRAARLDARTRRRGAPTRRPRRPCARSSATLFSVRVPRAGRRGSGATGVRRSLRISPLAHEHRAPARRATRARARIRGRRSASRSARSVIPSSRARSCASTSMSQRISRWSETKPTGHTSTSSTPRACRSVEVVEDVRPEPRLARRRLALVGERPVAEPARSATRRAVSRSCSWYGSPSSRMRAGSECAVKTTCALVPRTRSREHVENGSKSCQLSIMRSSARPASASSSCAR